MKRMLTAILSLLLLCSLVGCGNKNGGSSNTPADFGEVIVIYNDGTRYVFNGHADYLEDGSEIVDGYEFVGKTQKATANQLKTDFDSTHDGLVYIKRDDPEQICLVLGDGSWDSTKGTQPVLYLDRAEK